MLIGYARTSTAEQEAGLAAQIRDLQSAGCEKIFSEQVSSVAQRAKLDECLSFIREGDTLIVTKPDRLARSTAQLLTIADDLARRKINLIVQSMGMNLDSPTGKMMLTMLGAVAEFERAIMLERQREGIRRARDAGKYTGRQPVARRQLSAIQALAQAGKGARAIAAELGISRESVYRVARENGISFAA